MKVIQISINFAAFVPIQNGGRQREVAYYQTVYSDDLIHSSIGAYQQS